MTAPYTPLAIANQFITKYAGEIGIEHMKLQKLVYYSYGWWLASHGLEHAPLTNEEPEIWKHGPVFSSLYAVLKVFGRSPIFAVQSTGPFSEPDWISHDNNVVKLIDWIWSRYGHLSSFALSDMTHSPGTSWYRTAVDNNFSVSLNTKISKNYIFEEFSALVKAERPNLTSGENNVQHCAITA